MIRLTLALALLVALCSAAFAQDAKIVATCGTAPATYPVGSIRPVLMDQNGNLCTNASGSSGGGGSVTQGTVPWVVSTSQATANMVRGSGNTTGGTATTIIASAGGSLKNYITSVQCYRTDTGTSADVITFNDSASTVMILPAAGANFAGSGAIASFPGTPLVTAAATAFQFTSGSSITTVYCNAQGYTAN